LRELRRGFDVLSDPEHARRLGDLGDLRMREMDDVGIAMQVISYRFHSLLNRDVFGGGRRTSE